MKTAIEMAIEAGITPKTIPQPAWITQWCAVKELERFAALVRADEREACAKVCDDLHIDWKWRAAEAIRARSNT